jgi:hypothetical protein
MVIGNRYTTCNLVMKLDIRIMRKIAEAHANMISKFAEILPDKETAVYFVVHPFPARFGRNSASCGGNIMGVENLQEDCILLQASLATDSLPRSAYIATFKECLDELQKFAEEIGRLAVLLRYNVNTIHANYFDRNASFCYLNYSDISQDPLGTYGEDNIQKMREVTIKYDPTGVFQKRVPGGFKIPNINLGS